MREKVAQRPRTSEEILLPAVTRPEIFPAVGKYKRVSQRRRNRRNRNTRKESALATIPWRKSRSTNDVVLAVTLTFISQQRLSDIECSYADKSIYLSRKVSRKQEGKRWRQRLRESYYSRRYFSMVTTKPTSQTFCYRAVRIS